jgi:hypothetical protein
VRQDCQWSQVPKVIDRRSPGDQTASILIASEINE